MLSDPEVFAVFIFAFNFSRSVRFMINTAKTDLKRVDTLVVMQLISLSSSLVGLYSTCLATEVVAQKDDKKARTL